MSERIKQLDSPHNACQFRENCRKAEAEIARMRDVLTSKGFVECDIPACNCGWHHKYGLPERWAEIKEVLIDADVLNNDTGNTPLNAIKKLIAQLAERDAEIARLREDAERYQFLRNDFSVSSPNMNGNHAWAYRRNFSLKGPTLDAAIDAARKDAK